MPGAPGYFAVRHNQTSRGDTRLADLLDPVQKNESVLSLFGEARQTADKPQPYWGYWQRKNYRPPIVARPASEWRHPYERRGDTHPPIALRSNRLAARPLKERG